MAARRHIICRCVLVAAVASLALVLVTPARALGGRVAFVGGTSGERAEVLNALEVSRFNWNVVPAQIRIHIAPGETSHAVKGEIWLDADLLGAGTFAWGVVQHEYAHRVDFFSWTTAIARSSRKSSGPMPGVRTVPASITTGSAANGLPRHSRGPTGPPR
jgi:hypothetical protein